MELEERVEALEAAVARLLGVERQAVEGVSAETSGGAMWLANALRESDAPGGALAYGGAVELPTGEAYLWQWQRSGSHVLDLDWSAASSVLDALGSAVRLRILHAVLGGVATTAELGQLDGLGTTGQLHHHLRTLVAAGWLRGTARGRYAVPAPRVVPLMIIVLAGAE